MNVSLSVELCAGKKVERKKEAFLAQKDQNDQFVFEQVKANRQLMHDVTYGGQDACTGDSGGPLWKWIGRKR